MSLGTDGNDRTTWWLEERRPLALDQVTRGGGFPGATQLRSRLWPSWMSAMEGWMETGEELCSAAQAQTQTRQRPSANQAPARTSNTPPSDVIDRWGGFG